MAKEESRKWGFIIGLPLIILTLFLLRKEMAQSAPDLPIGEQLACIAIDIFLLLVASILVYRRDIVRILGEIGEVLTARRCHRCWRADRLSMAMTLRVEGGRLSYRRCGCGARLIISSRYDPD
jgi:hypothetical protein